MVERLCKCADDLLELGLRLQKMRVRPNRSKIFATHCCTRIGQDLELDKDDKDVLENACREPLGALAVGLRIGQAEVDPCDPVKAFEMDAIIECLEKLVANLSQIRQEYAERLPRVYEILEGAETTDLVGDIPLVINLGLGGKTLDLVCSSEDTLRDLKLRIRKLGGPRPQDQKITLDGALAGEGKDDAKFAEMGITKDSNVTLVCTVICAVCCGECKCPECHGEGRFKEGCKACGVIRPDCKFCRGPCKCPECHGGYYSEYQCKTCGQYAPRPCWGGDTKVLLPNGGFKNVRDCRVGDEVCTLLGSRRIARIWTHDPELARKAGPTKDGSGVEVCCIDGVWITSHHPIIRDDKWVYPTDLQAIAPWQKRMHVVPDLFNFELEGHDDTILLWGGGNLMVSCTIGKYMGPKFGRGVFTRRSTRCKHACVQCDAVFDPSMNFANLPPGTRWARYPEFPQVDWDDSVSEFELAAMVCEIYAPILAEADMRCAQPENIRNEMPVAVAAC